jgi:hypothetical protein
MQSGLPPEILGQIWTLSCFISSLDSSIMLGITFPEFALAMFLVKAKLGGRDVPTSLPDKVRQAVSQSVLSIRQRFGQSASSTLSNNMNQPTHSQSGSTQRPLTQQQPPMAVQIPSSNFSNSPSLPTQQHTPIHSQSQKTTPLHQAPVTLAGSPSLGTPSASSWAISPEEKAKYDAIFKAWDMGSTGYVTSDRARQIFSQSGLSPSILNHIW